MPDEGNIVDRAILLADLLHEPVRIADGRKILHGNELVLLQVQFLLQNPSRISRPQVRTGQYQVDLSPQLAEPPHHLPELFSARVG